MRRQAGEEGWTTVLKREKEKQQTKKNEGPVTHKKTNIT